MSFDATAVKVLIASPSDVESARDRIEQTIHRWNAAHAEATNVVLLPMRWESNATAEVGDSPQSILNRQLVDSSDVLIGAFWTRLGTPTESRRSGTAEEIARFVDAGKPACIYFSDLPAALSSVDTSQLDALRLFRTELEAKALVQTFDSLEELERRVSDALARVVREHFSSGIPAVPAIPSAPRADVRAKFTSIGGGRDYVTIRNYGPGEARDVQVRTIDAAGGDRVWELIGADDPLPFLPADGEYRFQAALDLDSPTRVNLFITWSNQDGSGGSSRQTIGFA